MDSSELIELFYNRTYEKFINKHILDDKNFVVPRQQLTNYVYELINIPFIQFVEYLKEIEFKKNIEVSDVTQFTSFSACEIDMCNALIWANNPGCQYLDIGRFFPNKINSPNDTAYKRYGEINIKASSQLGLSFEYYGYWYLSCLGYIYPDLDKEVKSKLLARTITRNSLYQRLLIEILNHDVKPEKYMDMLSEQIVRRRLRNVCFFLEICLNECREQNINIHYLIKSYDFYEKHDVKQHPLGTNKNLCKYLDEFDYHNLSIDTTSQLIKKYREGDHTATEILVKGYMRLVISIAQTYVNKGIGYGDLIQEGIIGLIKSFDHYNVDFNGGFSKYAQWWIRQSMSEAIFTQSLLVQVPMNARIAHRKVWKEINMFEQKNGYPPSVSDINIDDETDNIIIQIVSNMPEQLEAITVLSDNWDDLISDSPLPDDSLMKESQSYYVFALTNILDQKYAQILRSAYGIRQMEKTYSEIGLDWGVTRERIRQIVESSIRKLRSKTTLSKIEDIDVQIFTRDESPSNKTKTNIRDKQTAVCPVNEQPIKVVNNTINPTDRQKNDFAVQPKSDTTIITAPPKVSTKTHSNSKDHNIKDNEIHAKKPITINTDIINKIFSNTVSTYKYFWFISILQLLHNTGNTKLYVFDIISRMVANAWCPIACNRLSFGSGDSLRNIINKIQIIIDLPDNAKTDTVYNALKTKEEDPLIKRQLQIISRNVPFRFLTPWQTTNKNGQSSELECIYALYMESERPYLIINTLWKDYLDKNYEDLLDYSYQELSVFLQKRNSQTGNILVKLKVPNKVYNKKESSNYCVVYKGKQSLILNPNGEALYSSTGRIKQIGSLFYRIYFTYSSININQIDNSKDSFFKTGKRIISAKYNSTLFKILDEHNYEDTIDDIRSIGERRIKVKNIWFNEVGDMLDLNNKYDIISRNIQHEENKNSGDSNNIPPKKREAKIGDRILYNTKQCLVVDKQEMDGSARLIVRYDNGIIDNLQNDCNKYRVI